MSFRIEKRVGVRATAERIWDILADFDGWDRWNPIETGVRGSLGFRAEITLNEAIPGLKPRTVTARVGDWEPQGQLIWLEKRGFQFGVIRYYEIEQLAPGSCIVANGAIFSGLFGEGFHDKNKRAIRAAYDQVAEALRIEAEAGAGTGV